MSAWVLPDHIADVLPSEARHIEELRRLCLDSARSFGYELIMPPLLEHLESLLSGSGTSLDLQTFKLIDQLSGRTLGLRADTTPQVARIDAHLLNRAGVTRLCYCGPVLHTRASKPFATREPLQLGAEIYGHQGLEADLEIIELAMHCLDRAGEGLHARALSLQIELGDARIIRSVLNSLGLSPSQAANLESRIASKDKAGVSELTHAADPKRAKTLIDLLDLYGSKDVLIQARLLLSDLPEAVLALDQLQWLHDQLNTRLCTHAPVQISFDLSDMRGYSYYTGTRFSVYTQGLSDALIRGGRYDEVGAVFGRSRPAVGFSLDLKDWVQLLARPPKRVAIKAPWSSDAGLITRIKELREQGETVICMLPGHEVTGDEFTFDRELVCSSGAWSVVPLE
jgi:ATP phosphoribosyltransferase regulatory subunit